VVVLPLADPVAAVPLLPASEVALQPHAPLRPLAAQAGVVPAARGRRASVLMLAMARRVLARWVLARRAHQVLRRWVLVRRAHQVSAFHAWVHLALGQRWALRLLHPARRRCRAPQPPGRRQLALLVEVPAVAERRVPERPVSERAALRDHPLAEQEPRVRQVATGMPHLAEGSLPKT